MVFETLHELWSMNGHGAYVWLAYILSFFIIIYLIIHPIILYKKIMNEIRIRNLSNENKEFY